MGELWVFKGEGLWLPINICADASLQKPGQLNKKQISKASSPNDNYHQVTNSPIANSPEAKSQNLSSLEHQVARLRVFP